MTGLQTQVTTKMFVTVTEKNIFFCLFIYLVSYILTIVFILFCIIIILSRGHNGVHQVTPRWLNDKRRLKMFRVIQRFLRARTRTYVLPCIACVMPHVRVLTNEESGWHTVVYSYMSRPHRCSLPYNEFGILLFIYLFISDFYAIANIC